MDLICTFRHSSHADEELKYSLRSVARHLPWLRKAWIIGDRPAWMSTDEQQIEHVPHAATAWIFGYTLPVTNGFLLLQLASVLPELASEFLVFADDYVILRDLPKSDFDRPISLQDLNATADKRSKALFKEALWRTYDVLKRLKLPTINYESHLPVRMTKSQILRAAQTFRPYLSQDRYFGPLARTAILNLAQSVEGWQPIPRKDQGYLGYHKSPPSYRDVCEQSIAKTYLNFDDNAYGPGLKHFLAERFPEPSRFEVGWTASSTGQQDVAAAVVSSGVASPVVAVPSAPAASTDSDLDRALGLPAVVSNGVEIDPQHCVIIVPYRDRIVSACEQGLLALQQRGYTVRRILEGAAFDRERCRLATQALAEGFAETFWISGEIGFDAADVDRVRRHGLPICCALYPKTGQRAFAARLLPETSHLIFGVEGGLTEILHAGAGFLHVRREVYEQVEEAWNLPRCGSPNDKQLVPYFLPMIRRFSKGASYLSEDYAFCHRVRGCGIPIVADTTIRLYRFGLTGYSWEETATTENRSPSYRLSFSSPALPFK